MARHTTPTAIKEARGSFKKHPERRPSGEFEPELGIGPAPPSLGVEAEIWDEVVQLLPSGVLGNTDRIALEIMCKLIFRMRHDFDSMTAAQITRLETLLARFGMTPADRTKIVVPKSKPKNPFEGM